MFDSLHILIVDDRPDGVLFLSEFLHTRGHFVEISNDGQEALEAILRRHRTSDAYDLVFATLTMARLDGLALMRNLRQRHIDVPMALYVSPNVVTPEISQQSKILKCLAILEKPLALQRIERLITEVMQRTQGTTVTRREDDKPFFGTARIRRGEGVVDTPPQPPPPPPSPRNDTRRHSSVELQPTDTQLPAVQSPVVPNIPPPPLNGFPPPMAAPLPATPPSIPPPVAPPIPPYIPARPAEVEQVPQPPDRNQDQPLSTAFTRRSVDQRVRTPTNTYSRRSSGLFTPPSEKYSNPASISPPSTTRLRRTISGVHQPATAIPPGMPEAGPFPTSRSVACAHCQQVFLVVSKPQAYTVVCVHCGQLNRIDPF